MSKRELTQLHLELKKNFEAIRQEQATIKRKLALSADGKNLKGDEIVGWLGEIYGKLLLDGTMVADNLEYDFIAKNGKKVSTKARKGTKSGWKRTSAIPRIEGTGCPSHLMFVHLDDDYSVDRIWLYPWQYLRKCGRFKEHIVRGSRRSFYFAVAPLVDEEYLIYRKEGDSD